MRSLTPFIKIFFTSLALLLLSPNANGQLLKKLKKSAERAAERTVERRVEQEATKKTDAALDSIIDPGAQESQKEDPGLPHPPENGNTGGTNNPDQGSSSEVSTTGEPGSLKVYTNYDFVAGDHVLLYDDFSVDQLGDFPAKWNTNGAGEVVKLNAGDDKWLKLSNDADYVPDLAGTLPEDYTLEFDMVTTGLDNTTSSIARFKLTLDDNNTLRLGTNFAEMSIPFCQYTDVGVYVSNYFNGQNTVRNYINKDVRKDVLKRVHVAVAVNGPRFRMWMNERKLVDLPRFIEVGLPKYFKLDLHGMPGEDSGQFIFVSNIKLAEGGEDLRSKLVKEGKFSTTGILFDPSSDKIKPESYGTLKMIAEALQQESDMQIKIVGHTDADGSEESNMELSQKRAVAVRNSLVGEFGVSSTRIQTDGKGESTPVSDNSTTEGKAQNRRVEFIKI